MGVSNHQPHDCLLNRLFGCSNAENVSIWWRHHVNIPFNHWTHEKHWEYYCFCFFSYQIPKMFELVVIMVSVGSVIILTISIILCVLCRKKNANYNQGTVNSCQDTERPRSGPILQNANAAEWMSQSLKRSCICVSCDAAAQLSQLLHLHSCVSGNAAASPASPATSICNTFQTICFYCRLMKW